MKLLLKSAHIIDPVQDIDCIGDILVEDGKIVKLGQNLPADGAEVLDAAGLYAAPGLFDMHVHLRDPGFTAKEDILTGCEAAVAGGFTAVMCMPNTKPVTDSEEVLSYILEKAGHAKADVYPVASITAGMNGETLSDFAALKAAGAVAFSDDGKPVKNAAMMQQAMVECKKIGALIASHCEDLDIIDGGIINKGRVSEALGVKGMNRSSEDSITAREIALAQATGTAIHICHVSTRGSFNFIRAAKQWGVQVTCETAPHYMLLTEEKLLSKDANFRMNPPLRTEDDRQAVLEAVKDGTVDAIVTDHAPHTKEEKSDFYKAPNGITGLETSFAASYTALVDSGLISLSRLIELMTVNPRKLVGVGGGTLKEGAMADIFLFDPQESFVVDKNKMHSKASNTAFDGMTLKGKVKYTLHRGEIVYSDR